MALKDIFGRKKQIDDTVDRAVNGRPKPKAQPKGGDKEKKDDNKKNKQ